MTGGAGRRVARRAGWRRFSGSPVGDRSALPRHPLPASLSSFRPPGERDGGMECRAGTAPASSPNGRRYGASPSASGLRRSRCARPGNPWAGTPARDRTGRSPKARRSASEGITAPPGTDRPSSSPSPGSDKVGRENRSLQGAGCGDSRSSTGSAARPGSCSSPSAPRSSRRRSRGRTCRPASRTSCPAAPSGGG